MVEPGDHGADVAGTQGMGVNTPSAAAVAAATVGLAGERQVPKDGIFTRGVKSSVVAAHLPLTVTTWFGIMLSGAGEAPIEH